MKKLFVFGFLLACVLGLYFFPGKMISPGDLLEGHKKTDNDCMACHSAFQGIDQRKCIACHKVNEIGKLSNGVYEGRNVQFHQYLKETPCTSCHTDHQGRNPGSSISLFNHEMLNPLVLNSCNNCHHSPIDKLHTKLNNSCNSCHSTETWQFAEQFDHDLIKADQRNLCSTCHLKPEDNFHSNFTENCDKCHSVSAWKPSTFDHSSYFELDRDHNVQCITCHTGNNFSSYTCYGCHEHSESKLIQEHREEGIFNIAKCTSCHRNADEDDIRDGNRSGTDLKQGEAAKMREYIKSDKKRKPSSDDDDD